MSSLKAFFAKTNPADIVEEFVVSERFRDEKGNPIPWKIRALTEAENEELRRASTQYVKGKNGQRVPETKPEVYLAKIAAASVLYPDLKDADLQKSYGVMGAEDLLKRMLLAGEYAALIQKVQEINGFDKDLESQIEEVKN
jgi:hypothetical protein